MQGARALIVVTIALLTTTACQMNTNVNPIRTAQAVDLQRFMGEWYVIGNIPTFIETNAYNSLETYALNEDGTIDTTFEFNDGGFDGKRKRYNPKGFVRSNTGNAVWGMQFIWPFKAEYRILYVDDDYQTTIIGRTARDYVWIMSRTPSLPDDVYTDLVQRIEEDGYDLSSLRKVPQQWDAT